VNVLCAGEMIKNLKKIVWSFTLIAVLSVLLNNTLFIHSHTLPDGRVIEHAHPFRSADNGPHPLPNHKHTQQEFLLLSNIYHLFSNSYVLFIVIIFLIGNYRRHFLFESEISYLQINKKVKSLRAPPQSMLSEKYTSLLTNHSNLYFRRNTDEKNVLFAFLYYLQYWIISTTPLS
jgi:hypothetical protein